MRSNMMDAPPTVPALLRHAATYHGTTEIVSRTVEGLLHRTTYAETWQRCGRLASAMVGLGLKPDDRVGTLAWNGYRHLEIYYATACAGFVCHTINPRLFPAQVASIIEHAADRVLFVDLSFVALLETIADHLSGVIAIVVMTDMAHMPARSPLPRLLCYEELLASQPDGLDWPAPDEDTVAALCYTSGTTGHPKGVAYSHRSIVLHAMAVCLPDAFCLGAASVAMPVVPMFHVNAWGLPHAAPLVGAKLVLPGPNLDGRSLHELIVSEGVTFSAGVPTVWTGLLDWVAERKEGLGPLRRVGIGGSACPPSMFSRFRKEGVEVLHAWGMTETSPVGLVNSPKQGPARSPEAEAAFSAKQGRPLFGLEIRVVDGHGREVPQDGVATGSLQVRGPWVAQRYFDAPHDLAHASPGWFDTGDVVTVDGEGFVQILDRTKDVIKSGGEWISSIELENIAMSHPAVHEAAVIGRPDPRWDERPILVVVLRPGAHISGQDLLAHYTGRVARWCIPDDVTFVDELPHTATGKLLKTRIRDLYATLPLARDMELQPTVAHNKDTP